MINLKKKNTSGYIFIILAAFILAGVAGCGQDNTVQPVSSGSNNLSFSSASDKQVNGNNPQSTLELFEAKVLINDLKINIEGRDDDEHCASIKTGPFVIVLNLDSKVTEVTSASIPAGNYKKVKFEIHKLQGNEVSPDPDFVDMNGRYSVVVRGAFNGLPFVYKSSVTANQQVFLQKTLAVTTSEYLNLTFYASPMVWFADENGILLDPSLEINRGIIDANIKNNLKHHIRVFVDNDRDGKPDN